ncbi:MAG: glycosyltransferase [bacterium]|nr:glycosyltransferase [bacterium]
METVLENLMTGLLDAGVQVQAIVSSEHSHDSTQIIKGLNTKNSGKLIRTARVGHINSQPMNLGLVNVVRRQIESFRPDLVHLHQPNPLAAFVWFLLKNFWRIDLPPLVVWHHADITRQKLGARLVSPLIGKCYGASLGICVSSASLAQSSSLLKVSGQQAEIIPFGIEGHPWLEIAPQRSGNFLFIGRLVPYKGLSVLLTALQLSGECKLDVVGEGPLLLELQNQVQQLGLSSRVFFHGSCEPAQLANLMSKARALILPSINESETFGLVQLEAMASGLAVIATRLNSGVAEVGVDGETCLLVPPNDSKSLAAAITTLIEDDDLTARLGQKARERFQQHYTREIMGNRVKKWYQELLDFPNQEGVS